MRLSTERPRLARLSIVVPVYFNALNLPDTVPQLLALRDQLDGMTLELVFVDDGSGDESLPMLLEWRARYPEVISVVALSRNFGAMSAVLAGLHEATGDCVGVIAADLQDPPELLVQMADHWKHGHQTVLAVRADREESWSQRFAASVYYRLIRRFAIKEYPPGGFDLVLIDRAVVREIVQTGEKNTNLMSLIFWMGFSPVMIPYVRRARTKGVSRWTFAKKVKLFVDSFVAFSYAPVRAASAIGAIVALVSFAYGVEVIVSRLRDGAPVPGFATLAVAVAFSLGLQMLTLGILGEYLWRVLDETRRRPQFVVAERFPATADSSKESIKALD